MNESQPPGMTARQVRTLLKVLPVALLVGLTLAIWGIYLVHFHLNLIIHGETATGKVIALERGISSSSSSPAWFPVVKFSAQNAQLVTFRHRDLPLISGPVALVESGRFQGMAIRAS